MDTAKKVSEEISAEVNRGALSTLISTIPLLKEISLEMHNKPEFKMLVGLLLEMQQTKYEASKKYELAYKVSKICILLQYLLPNITPESSVDVSEKYKDEMLIAKLTAPEQMALFNLSRNSFGHFYHFLLESEVEKDFNNFIQLCNGTCNPSSLANQKSFYQSMCTKPMLKTVLLREDIDNSRKQMLLSQMGYFLLKAEQLAIENNYYGACQALIAAGGCATFFNQSGVDPLPESQISVTNLLANMKGDLVHIQSASYNEKELFEKFALPYIQKIQGKDGYIDLIEKRAAGISIKVDVVSYAKALGDKGQAVDRQLFVNKLKEKAEKREELSSSMERSESNSVRGRGGSTGFPSSSRGRSNNPQDKLEKKSTSPSLSTERGESNSVRGRGTGRGIPDSSRGRGSAPPGKLEKEATPPSLSTERRGSYSVRARGAGRGIPDSSRGRGSVPPGKLEKEATAPSLSIERGESNSVRGRGTGRGFTNSSRGRGSSLPDRLEQPEQLSSPIEEQSEKIDKTESEKQSKKNTARVTCKEDELKKDKKFDPDKDGPSSSGEKTFRSPSNPSSTTEKRSGPNPTPTSGGNNSGNVKSSTVSQQNVSLMSFNYKHNDKKQWSTISEKPSLTPQDIKNIPQTTSEVTKPKAEKPTVETNSTVVTNSPSTEGSKINMNRRF